MDPARLTYKQLTQIARRERVPGYSRMRKDELLRAVIPFITRERFFEDLPPELVAEIVEPLWATDPRAILRLCQTRRIFARFCGPQYDARWRAAFYREFPVGYDFATLEELNLYDGADDRSWAETFARIDGEVRHLREQPNTPRLLYLSRLLHEGASLTLTAEDVEQGLHHRFSVRVDKATTEDELLEVVRRFSPFVSAASLRYALKSAMIQNFDRAVEQLGVVVNLPPGPLWFQGFAGTDVGDLNIVREAVNHGYWAIVETLCPRFISEVRNRFGTREIVAHTFLWVKGGRASTRPNTLAFAQFATVCQLPDAFYAALVAALARLGDYQRAIALLDRRRLTRVRLIEVLDGVIRWMEWPFTATAELADFIRNVSQRLQ